MNDTYKTGFKQGIFFFVDPLQAIECHNLNLSPVTRKKRKTCIVSNYEASINTSDCMRPYTKECIPLKKCETHEIKEKLLRKVDTIKKIFSRKPRRFYLKEMKPNFAGKKLLSAEGNISRGVALVPNQGASPFGSDLPSQGTSVRLPCPLNMLK